MLCVAAGTVALALATPGFTLDWTHSVARTTWWERWEVIAAGLAPVEARISGAGAGMEPPPEARFHDGAWWYKANLPPQKHVVLAASGATEQGWRLCAQGRCHRLPEDQGPLHLWVAHNCDNPPS